MAEQQLSHCLADLAYPDIQAYLQRSDLILVPMASLEQHGPHLPLSTDTVTAYEVSKRAAEQADVLYTPTIWTGYSPQHMRGPGQGMGTITIRAETLLNLLYDVARSLIHHGFNKLIFVNGHGSNVKVIDPVLRKIRYNTGALVAFYKPYAERYMGLVKDLMENPPDETPGWHSSELETSQMLAHNAELVRMERAARTETHIPQWLPSAFNKADGAPDVQFRGYQYFQFPMDHDEFTDTGVIGNPMRASAEKGEEAFRRYAAHLVDAIAELQKVDVHVHTREFRDRV
ncbi:MAG TPA: creatininase family protein [Kouleothrix sp.]|uniref:creatininase family protein n=1 Tax=Kouleothrix sp. TaxID=2779161 RepID=UPI002C53BA3E|nr:creatininase family protein [Kouleothrix sp.]HRC75060.1 creatininase family protein [Kouleothrix sp.]